LAGQPLWRGTLDPLDGRESAPFGVAQTPLLQQIAIYAPKVIPALLKLLSDSEESVRAAAARALGQVGQGHSEVVAALLTLLSYLGSYEREAAASALGQVGQGRSEVVKALLTLLSAPERYVRSAAASALGRLEIKNATMHRRVLIALNRRLHDRHDNVRGAALTALRAQVEGRQLPGYRWTPLRQRQRRRRRIQWISWWVFVLCALLLLALLLAVVAARLDANSLLVRWGLALVGLSGLLAGLAQIIGRALRNPFEGE
jgi:hypothetical protein